MKTISIEILRRNNYAYFILLVLTWVTHYFYSFSFGLYEDDYWFSAYPINGSFQDLINQIILCAPKFGRFIGNVVPLIFSYLGFKIGGLWGVYFIGFLLVWLNTILIYKIISRTFSRELGFLTAIMFIIFPADTTRALLVHAFQLHVSLIFTLSGILLYCSDKKKYAYPIAFLSLITYENAFLPFIAAPLFNYKSFNKKIVTEFIKHLFIIFIFFLILFLFRKFAGEERVAELELWSTLRRLLLSFILGPITVVWSYIKALTLSLKNIVALLPILIPSIIFFLYLILKNITFLPNMKSSDEKLNINLRFKNILIDEDTFQIFRFIFCGLFIFIVGYVFAFTHYPPVTLQGRGTSVHFGGSLGISMITAGGLLLLLQYKGSSFFLIKGIFTALLLSLLLCHGILVQRDYRRSAHFQSRFWNQLIALCPDVKPNTIIIISNANLDSTSYIQTHSWSDPIVLENLIEFPKSWQRKPKAVAINLLHPDLKKDKSLFFINNELRFMYNFKDTVYLENNNTILLQQEGNSLKRYYKNIVLAGDTLVLKKRDTDSLYFRKAPLADFILKER